MNSSHVRLRPIPLVCCKAVHWPLLICLKHHPIPRDLGNDGCCSDREALGVTLNDCLDVVCVDVGRPPIAVYEYGGRSGAWQALNCGLHCTIGGLEDVDLVNALSILNASANTLSVTAVRSAEQRSDL